SIARISILNADKNTFECISTLVPQNMSNITTIKLVLVGDGTVGKTSMVLVYTLNTFPEEYAPTVADDSSHYISVDGKAVRLSIYDTAGQESYDRLRPLGYKDTNVFLLCYSVDNRDSYQNVKAKWVPELRHFGGFSHSPVVLVATKTDTRDDQVGGEAVKDPISTAEGEKLAKEINADRFVECSAKKSKNLDAVFTEAVRAHFHALQDDGKKKKKQLSCGLL
ncbi:hypothetical protein BOX15_Mlig000443g3, partial [Macrostomum lignano]